MSASSSNSANIEGRLNDRFDYEPSVYCNCGLLAKRLYSWTAKNPGRRFYRCQNDRVHGCTFFRWHDPEINHQEYKEVICSLRKEVLALRSAKDRMQRLLAIQADTSRMEFVNEERKSTKSDTLRQVQGFAQVLKKMVVVLIVVNIVLVCWLAIGR
ncbi:hypothetical protein LINPERPRIM_LOCUS42781 [Linum perenne]